MASSKLNKRDIVIRALRSRRGASVPKLCKLTDWKAPSVRAELSRLRKNGHEVSRKTSDRAGIPATYRLTPEPRPTAVSARGRS
jgi:hypothetical protein